MDLIQLKTIQDWVVERKLRIVPGIADISPLGGKTKEYQVEIDLDRMRSYGLTLPQIISAISTSNANVGGRTIADRRAVGQRARRRCARIDQRHQQYRCEPAGRIAGRAVRHRAQPGRLYPAVGDRSSRQPG